MLAQIAKPLLRPMPGPLREMVDAELAAAITALEERVAEGELVVARLQPELETAAAESFAGADLGSVKNNATAMRDAESALTTAKTTLAGLRHELERRAAENVIERAERRRKTAEAAADDYVAQALLMDDAYAAFVACRMAVHETRRRFWESLPTNVRADIAPDQLQIGQVDEQLRMHLAADTGGEFIRVRGLDSPHTLRERLRPFSEHVAEIKRVLPTIVFSGADK